jgi:hypothetical protein
MDGLLPIIRRVRRPLLPVETATDAKPVVVPVKAEIKASGESPRAKHEEEHGEAAASEPAK